MSFANLNQLFSSQKFILLINFWLVASLVEAGAPWNEFRQPVHIQLSQTTTTTTMEPPIIEDSLNSATSESSAGSEQDDALCFKCYDQVEMAKTLISIQSELVKQQNELIRKLGRKNSTPKPETPSTRSPKRQVSRSVVTQQGSNNENKTNLSVDNRPIHTRTWSNSDDNYKPHVVVSTLRVARSTDHLYSANQGPERKNRIPALKQWENKRKQQLNETCKSLNELHSCLEGISRECLGNFHYHSHEMFSTQWRGRLHCHNLDIKPWNNWIRSIMVSEVKEVKEPIARPISSPEEYQKRLDAMFGSRVGVMLKPTLTKSATQKFNAMGQQDQQLDKGGFYQEGQFKGHHFDEILNHKGSTSLSKSRSVGSVTSQLVLIPCFLVLCLAIIAITMGRYFKQNLPKK